MIKKIAVISAASIVVLLSLFAYLHFTNWSMKDIQDRTEIPLNHEINSYKDGLPFATERAKQWRKDAYLTNIVIGFQGKENINNRRGTIDYHYYAKNNSIFGLPDAVCWVTIDMDKRSIVEFRAFGGARLYGDPIDISRWNIDIKSMFDGIEKEGILELLNRYDNPSLVVRTNEEMWEVALYPSLESMGEDVTFRFETTTKKIYYVRDKLKE
ncbi:hypothetical protein [Gorillibacterium timonense]|uniref:hypothetical protein n=1 Tax=Gorillibacterium timonense TaxID=1689269 RepID=UPI00071C86BA|nr:hypothetical protein [Gorillibacterium timonense]